VVYVKKSKVNAFVDVMAFFPFVITAITGIIIWIFMPFGGTLRNRGGAFGQQFFLGIARHTWLDVHTYLGLIFIVLVAVHLILHWDYIKGLPRLLKRKQLRE
jgi:hypothetical protein